VFRHDLEDDEEIGEDEIEVLLMLMIDSEIENAHGSTAHKSLWPQCVNVMKFPRLFF